MSVFTSLEILIFSALIITSLKLIPGIFAYFYHYASGKYSAKKVSDLSIFFILGAETLPVVIFITLNFILHTLVFSSLNFVNNIFPWTIAGVLFALGFAYFLFYFQKGYGTKLFISRKIAKNFDQKARKAKTRSDAFVLGFIAGIPELIFTLPLFLISLIEILRNFILTTPCSSLLILFTISVISPLLFVYAYFRNGNNLADFEKLRIKNKSFFRLFIALLYFLLALLIIIFRT